MPTLNVPVDPVERTGSIVISLVGSGNELRRAGPGTRRVWNVY
jgi:hypothetical protein